MATTTNLGITKLNSADYVSVDPINEALDTLDKLGVDYVTASGTSGEWWYRKWKSGRAECGIDSHNFGTVNVDQAWGAMFVSANQTFGAYPFSFAAKPHVNIQFQGSDAGETGQQSYVAAASSTSTSTSPYFRLVDPYSNQHNNVLCSIKVEGRYK